MRDWIKFLREADFGDRLDISQLKAGDVILVATEHTSYRLEVTDAEEFFVQVSSDRKDRPEREMRLMGCTIGDSSTISPDSLFCGGNLEMNWCEDGELHTFKTTLIGKLTLIQRE